LGICIASSTTDGARKEPSLYITISAGGGTSPQLTSDAIARLKEAGARYAGRPYDLQFRWSDERMYCSELVWKMYKEALDLEIGEIETFRDFSLSDPTVARKLEERFGARIPLDEKVVSPASMFESERLVTVYDN
jgi:hypothetical protein